MKGKDLFEKITELDEDLIEEAARTPRMRNNKSYGWVVMLVVAFIGVGAIALRVNNKVNQGQGFSQGNEGRLEQEIGTKGGVVTSKIELPKNTSGADYDMIGLIVYNGRIYTHSETYYREEALELEKNIGDYVGYAKGNIDEWSSQEDYAKELASTYLGDVYKVKGYGDEFRLSMKEIYTDENGEETPVVLIFENLNGVSLYKGQDLFGSPRLNMEEGWEYVKYQEFDNWNYGTFEEYEYYDLEGVTTEEVEEFFKELNASEFVSLEKTDIYDKENHHIYVYMKDGTRIHLRLFEGGYVGYQPLGWYFVKMPGDIFDKLYEASK